MKKVSSKMLSSNKFGGKYTVTHANVDGEILSVETVQNICPNEGLTYFNNVLFAGLASSSYYVGLYVNNYTPLDTDVMATFLTTVSEFTTYDETARQLYVPVVSTVNTSNVASKAVFTINATGIVRGVFLSTTSVKGSTAGSLISAKLLAAAKNVAAGDTLSIQYDFTSSSI